jgi:hypothetical protein
MPILKTLPIAPTDNLPVGTIVGWYLNGKRSLTERYYGIIIRGITQNSIHCYSYSVLWLNLKGFGEHASSEVFNYTYDRLEQVVLTDRLDT